MNRLQAKIVHVAMLASLPLFTGLSLAQQHVRKTDLAVALVIPKDAGSGSGKIVFSQEKGCAVRDIDLAAVAKAQMLPALVERFSRAVMVEDADAAETAHADLQLHLALSNVMAELGERGAKTGRIRFDLELRGAAGGKQVFGRRVQHRDQFEWTVSLFSSGMLNATIFNTVDCSNADFRRDARKAAEAGLGSAMATLLNDKEVVAAVDDFADSRKGETLALHQGLQAMDGKFRVTEPDASIRKLPDSRAPLVRRLNPGTTLHVSGRLANGWLQVAREGEAVGWIHEGLVTPLGVQPQPAAAAAATLPAAVVPTVISDVSFPTKPVTVSFTRGRAGPEDIAVIIGNANYRANAKDIPDVVPAYADAEGMRRYASQALGIRDENIIFIRDAKLKDMVATFGTDRNPRGKLYNWAKPQSNVFIYYSGHGAPSSDGAGSYLVPADAEASLIDVSGYPLKTLYANLGKLPAKSVTVVLEACFSGATQDGMLVKNASPIYQKAAQETAPSHLTVISAGSGNQIASWEQDRSHSLFTKHYLLGMAGAADRKPYGDGDGKVSSDELAAYLKGTMSYLAQRYYGREQTAQIAVGKPQ